MSRIFVRSHFILVYVFIIFFFYFLCAAFIQVLCCVKMIFCSHKLLNCLNNP